MENLQDLISIIKEARSLLALESNDFSWSSWIGQTEALSEIDSIIRELENGSIPDIRGLFAPTGPIQEVSLNSGWEAEFVELAERFDKAYKIVKDRS